MTKSPDTTTAVLGENRASQDRDLYENVKEQVHAQFEHAKDQASAQFENIRHLAGALRTAETTNPKAIADARSAIQKAALSVLVRDGWHAPGASHDIRAEEFQLLLRTGGPAVRLYGQLDEVGKPVTAELEFQDGSMPWVGWSAPQGATDILLSFARCFSFATKDSADIPTERRRLLSPSAFVKGWRG